MKCERCDGAGFVVGYGCPGFKRIELSCDACSGTGELSEADKLRIAEGKAMRDDRVLRGMGLREEAKRLGISPTELSYRERGALRRITP